MKKIMMLCFLLFTTQISMADTVNEIPDTLSVREHWISLTKSYNIETKTKKLGTLYRRFFSLLLTYDFYDNNDKQTATAKARFFSLGAYLDIYDQTGSLLGGVDEKIFTIFPTFDVFAADSSTKLARASMNFWGTKFYIYDPATGQEMALMSRPFFRLKNDWIIEVTNRSLLNQKNIDSRVLMTVLAVQGEIEDWRKDHNNDLKALKSNPSENALERIKNIAMKENLGQLNKPSQDSLEALADNLEKEFKVENPSADIEMNAERGEAFISYCLNLVSSKDTSPEKKKEIMTLLNMRLQGHA